MELPGSNPDLGRGERKPRRGAGRNRPHKLQLERPITRRGAATEVVMASVKFSSLGVTADFFIYSPLLLAAAALAVAQ